jgi:hypothetical protein
MVVTKDYAEASDAIAPSPAGTSLRGLDGVDLFLAGVLSGFGPYVAAVASLGRAAGFLGIAAVALAAVLLLWLLMPETDPLHQNELR